MNKEDKIRFARYYPGYIETNSDIENETIDNKNNNTGNNTGTGTSNTGTDTSNNINNINKNVLGYIEEIKIDKNELIENIIKSKATA
jgi:hypothetical protein